MTHTMLQINFVSEKKIRLEVEPVRDLYVSECTASSDVYKNVYGGMARGSPFWGKIENVS